MLRPVLTALLFSTLLAHVCGDDNTHVDNHSKWTILVTTSYPGGDSKFLNRAIAPGGSDVDTYNPVASVNLDVKVKDAANSNHFTIGSDDSVIAQDNPDRDDGVDFYLNDGDGNPQLTRDGPEGISIPGLLVTIYGPGPPPSPNKPPAPAAPPKSPSPAPKDDGDEDVTPQRVFGKDDREPALRDGKAIYPNVGQITVIHRGNDGPANPGASGTAFLQPDDKIVTAAHVLFDAQNRLFDVFTVYFGRTEPSKFVERASGLVSDCEIPEQFKPRPSSKGRRAFDWAICKISRPHRNDQVTPFQLASSPQNQLQVTIVGYTGAEKYPDRFKKQFPLGGTPFMATCDAQFYFGNSIPVPNAQPMGDFFWGYRCDTTNGQSGAPLISDGKVLGNHWGSYKNVPLNLGTNLVNKPDKPFSVPAPAPPRR